jgi:hypothetical protein
MSEKKPPPHDTEKLDEVCLEIQRTAINILNTGAELAELEKKMAELQTQRAELRGGQKLFTLDELD